METLNSWIAKTFPYDTTKTPDEQAKAQSNTLQAAALLAALVGVGCVLVATDTI